MKKISIYEFTNYREYLVEVIAQAPRHGRGIKSSFAVAAGCQSAYVSRVLAQQAEFSLEQAEAISQYLNHSEAETHYFLLCVQFVRAGTPRLRAHFKKQMEDIRQRRQNLKERFQVKSTLSIEDQSTYYSSWLYTAAHMAATTPRMQTREALARHLGISVKKVSGILEFLLNTRMLVSEGEQLKLGTARFHLGSDSPLISKHHTNWRIQAIRSLDKDSALKDEDLHYTSIVSHSVADRKKLKALLLKTIDEFNALVAPSSEEEVHCLAMDFFSLSED